MDNKTLDSIIINSKEAIVNVNKEIHKLTTHKTFILNRSTYVLGIYSDISSECEKFGLNIKRVDFLSWQGIYFYLDTTTKDQTKLLQNIQKIKDLNSTIISMMGKVLFLSLHENENSIKS